MNHQNYLYLEYRRALQKFRKLQIRFEKRIANNTLKELTARKRYRLLKALRKLRDKIEQLSSRLKLATATGALAMGMAMTPPVEANASTQFVKAAAPETAAAPKVEVEGRILVNDSTDGSQFDPSVGMADDGEYVVAYRDENDNIAAKAYDQEGNEKFFQVTTGGQTSDPEVSMNSDGDFVVIWQEWEFGSGSYSVYSINYQRYTHEDADWTADTAIELISGTTDVLRYFKNLDVDLNDHGDFAVVWNESIDGGEGPTEDVYGKYVDPDDNISTTFAVDQDPNEDQHHPAIAIDNNADFKVVYADTYDVGSIYSVISKVEYAKATQSKTKERIHLDQNDGTAFKDVDMDMAPDGSFTVVWEYEYGALKNIEGRRFDGDGNALDSEFIVIQESGAGDNNNPAIAMDKDGGFVVAYETSTSQYEYIAARRYTRFGQSVTNPIIHSGANSATSDNVAIGMSPKGDFVIAWDDNNNDENDPCGEGVDCDATGVYYTRYADPANEPYCKTDAEFVNTTTDGSQTDPAVDQNADGDYVVVWSGYGNVYEPDPGIFGQRYDSDGNKVGSEFHINTETMGDQTQPDVAIADDDSFVVVWRSEDKAVNPSQFGIYAQMYDKDGVATGSELRIDGNGTSGEYILMEPAVSINNTGEFVVTWIDDTWEASTKDIYANRFNAPGYTNEGQAIDSEFQVNTYLNGEYYNPDVVLADDGSFVIAWGSDATSDSAPDSHFIFTRRYDTDASPLDAEKPVSTAASAQLYGIDMIQDDQSGDYLITWSLQSSPYYDVMLSKFKSDGSVDIDEKLISDHGWDTGTQSVAVDDNGDFAVAFLAYDDEGSKALFVSKFDESGTNLYENASVGGEDHPSVMFDSDGDPRVIYTQYFNGTEVLQKTMAGPLAGRIDKSNEFVVNTATDYSQLDAEIAKNADGNFVVVWRDADGTTTTNIKKIKAQRYNAEGERLGTEITVIDNVSYYVFNPQVSLDDNGDFMVAWEGTEQPLADGGTDYGGAATDIFAKVYDWDGGVVANTFIVNEVTNSNQREPDIALDPDGNFVVVWTDHHSGMSYSGFNLRRFSGGSAVTTNQTLFEISGVPSPNGLNAKIAINEDGDIAIPYYYDYAGDHLAMQVFDKDLNPIF